MIASGRPRGETSQREEPGSEFSATLRRCPPAPRAAEAGCAGVGSWLSFAAAAAAVAAASMPIPRTVLRSGIDLSLPTDPERDPDAAVAVHRYLGEVPQQHFALVPHRPGRKGGRGPPADDPDARMGEHERQDGAGRL